MEATMPTLTIIGLRSRSPSGWRIANLMLAHMRAHRLAMAEQEDQEEHGLDAMLHWRDPVERTRTLRSHHRTLVDDNPSSG
jgi:hypothetical protein